MPVQSPAAKQSETPATQARASETEMWRVEPGGASILARRKAQRRNSENAVVDNGAKGGGKEEIVRERQNSKKFSREATGQLENHRHQRTLDQNGQTQMTVAILLAKARREEAY